MSSTRSSHPDFPNGTEVVNIRAQSQFFGHRGTVYGSGGSRRQPESDSAVVFVRWPCGSHHAYFPSRLALAPLREETYLVSSKKRTGGGTVTTHEIRGHRCEPPTIFDRFAAQTSSPSPQS